MATKVKVKAIENFCDLERKVNVKVGDIFETSSKKRAEELSGCNNKLKKELVEILEDAKDSKTGNETNPDGKEDGTTNGSDNESNPDQDANENGDEETGASGEDK